MPAAGIPAAGAIRDRRQTISVTDEVTARQIAFFSRTTIDGPGVHAILSGARVVLAGDGAVAEHAAAGLIAAGMKSARVHAAQFSAENARGADCVLVCLDRPAPDLLHAINSAALHHGSPWISGRIESGAGMIGPAVIPGQSACYRCFELRRQANLALADQQQGPVTIPPDDGAAPGPLAGAVGSLLALEAMRLISRVALPQTMGAVLRLDFFSSGITSHRVLRLPNCPDCGYGGRRLPQMPPRT